MAIEFIVDNRTSVSHVIRGGNSRRISRILFHLLKRPFKDCNGRLVMEERRCGSDRRNF